MATQWEYKVEDLAPEPDTFAQHLNDEGERAGTRDRSGTRCQRFRPLTFGLPAAAGKSDLGTVRDERSRRNIGPPSPDPTQMNTCRFIRIKSASFRVRLSLSTTASQLV